MERASGRKVKVVAITAVAVMVTVLSTTTTWGARQAPAPR